MKKTYKTIGIGVFLALCIVILVLTYIFGGEGTLKKNNSEDIFVEEVMSDDIKKEEKIIIVEIKGEVKNPNVYKIKEGSVINDLIDISGGLTEDADVSKINRAKKLQNNECIIINSKQHNESGEVPIVPNQINNSNIHNSGLINLNTATIQQLDTLPGVGPTRAEAIIKYREENGGFKNIEEIMNIDGIGEKSFEKLKDKIEV